MQLFIFIRVVALIKRILPDRTLCTLLHHSCSCYYQKVNDEYLLYCTAVCVV